MAIPVFAGGKEVVQCVINRYQLDSLLSHGTCLVWSHANSYSTHEPTYLFNIRKIIIYIT